MSEEELEKTANDVYVVVLELVEVDVLAAIERHLELVDRIAKARHAIQALGLDRALAPLDLLHALLHQHGPDRVHRLHQRGQVDAEYALDETHLRLAVGRCAFRAFLVRLKAAVLALDALGHQAPHEVETKVAPVWTFEVLWL